MKKWHMAKCAQMCIATYADELGAEVARMSLESADIPAFVSKDECGGMQSHLRIDTDEAGSNCE